MKYEILVSDRKEVVKKVEELAGKKPRYTGMPEAAYVLDGIVIAKDNTMTADDDADANIVVKLIEERMIRMLPEESDDWDDPDEEDDIEYLPPDGEEEEDEEARFDDFLSYFKVQYPDEKIDTFWMEDGRSGIRLETENYNAEILPGDRSTLVIGIPMSETRKLKKQIRQINADGGMQCRYDRDRKETVFTLPFQAEDAPEDVSNLLRCVLDYEVPALREKGGDQ